MALKRWNALRSSSSPRNERIVLPRKVCANIFGASRNRKSGLWANAAGDEISFNETRDTGFLLGCLAQLRQRVPRYKPLSVGVVLLDLVPAGQHQPDLFAPDNHRRQKPSPVIDRINGRYAIGFGLFPPDVRGCRERKCCDWSARSRRRLRPSTETSHPAYRIRRQELAGLFTKIHQDRPGLGHGQGLSARTPGIDQGRDAQSG